MAAWEEPAGLKGAELGQRCVIYAMFKTCALETEK